MYQIMDTYLSKITDLKSALQYFNLQKSMKSPVYESICILLDYSSSTSLVSMLKKQIKSYVSYFSYFEKGYQIA